MLVADKTVVEEGLALEEYVAFGTVDLDGLDVERLITDLYLGVWMRFKVVTSIRVGIGARFRREHQVAATVFEIHHRVDVGHAGTRPGGVE
jgi:hypothetical protein